MRQLSLEGRLNSIINKPLDKSYLSEDAETDKITDTNVGDQRMRVNKSWTRWKESILAIRRMRNEAKMVGLDQEFRKIVVDVLGTRADEISAKDPIRFAEAFLLYRELMNRNFGSKIEAATEQFNKQHLSKSTSGIPTIAGAPDQVNEAINTLYSEPYKKTLSDTAPSNLHQLIFPFDTSADDRYAYRNSEGEQVVVVLSNDVSLKTQYNDMKKAIAEIGDENFGKHLINIYKLRRIIIDYAMPKSPQEQRDYTASEYAFRMMAILIRDAESRREKLASTKQ